MFDTRKESLEFIFSTIREEKIETIFDLARKEEVALTLDALKALLSRADIIGFIAKDKNGREAGLIIGTLRHPPAIRKIVIADPESVKKGLGGVLIDKFVEEVEKRQPKAPCINIDLPCNMIFNVALFSIKGFVVQGFVKGLRDGIDFVYLRKYFKKERRGLFSRIRILDRPA